MLKRVLIFGIHDTSYYHSHSSLNCQNYLTIYFVKDNDIEIGYTAVTVEEG